MDRSRSGIVRVDCDGFRGRRDDGVGRVREVEEEGIVDSSRSRDFVEISDPAVESLLRPL